MHSSHLMMAAATAGGYAGAPLARALPMKTVCGLIAVIGFGMSAISSSPSSANL